MDFNKLKAFVVVAEQLNFRKSADILGMSQPPLTRLISSLEDELGTQLFERTTRSVKLTGPGVLLLKETRAIMNSLEELVVNVRNAGKLKSGTLKVGFSRTAFLANFPTLIEEFQSRYPKIKIDLCEMNNKDILKKVKDESLDLAFIESVTLFEGLESHEVDSEMMGVLLPKKHRLAQKKVLSFSDLQDETIILHHKKEAEEFHERISKLIQGLKKKPSIYIKSDQETCPILVATGKGVSLTIASSQSMAPKQTVFVPIKNMFLPVSVFWKPENQNPSLKAFVGFAAEKTAVLHRSLGCLDLLSGHLETIQTKEV